jgi:hypothetical protein
MWQPVRIGGIKAAEPLSGGARAKLGPVWQPRRAAENQPHAGDQMAWDTRAAACLLARRMTWRTTDQRLRPDTTPMGRDSDRTRLRWDTTPSVDDGRYGNPGHRMFDVIVVTELV